MFEKISALLRRKCLFPKDKSLQYIPVGEKVREVETIRLRNGEKTDVFTCVIFLEIVKFGGKVIEVFERI